MRLKTGTVAVSCGHGKEPSVSIKGGESLYHMSFMQLVTHVLSFN
jgi:hypothetical protein